jgi:DNA-binding MarR family transcriptional regulator
MLGTIGAFRVVSESDLHDLRDDSSSLRRSLRHLEDEGLIRRTPLSSDDRAVVLTERGRDLLEANRFERAERNQKPRQTFYAGSPSRRTGGAFSTSTIPLELTIAATEAEVRFTEPRGQLVFRIDGKSASMDVPGDSIKIKSKWERACARSFRARSACCSGRGPSDPTIGWSSRSGSRARRSARNRRRPCSTSNRFKDGSSLV